MKKLFSTTIIVLFTSVLFAQTENVEGKKYIYEFRDGTVIIGTFLKSEAGNIYIMNKGEEVYLPKVMIAQIHEVTEENVREGEYWFPNMHDTRYFFSPTAFGLEEGEGYYSHSYWLLWQAQFGITDDFSIGGGTSVFGFPSTLNGKYSMNVKPLNTDARFAIGWFWVGDLFGLTGEDSRTFINMPYSVLTFGSKEKNITLGAGYNLSDEWSGDDHSERAVLNGGAIFRTSRRFAFVFEGWIFDPLSDNPSLLGGPGIRYFRKINRVTAKNGAGASTWDFQFISSPEFDGIIPMVGASRKF